MSGLVEITILAGVLVMVATWLIAASILPQRPVRLVSPRRRAWAARAQLYALVWAPPVVLLGAFVPGLIGTWTAHGDHCLADGHAHHHHLCLLHPPHATGHWLTWAAPLVVLVPVLAVLAQQVWRGRWQRRLARTLVATSHPSALGPDVRLLARDEPIALTVGVRTPTILLSTGLLEGASGGALQVVLAHERAHVSRGDTRLASWDQLAAALLPRSVAGPLLERIILAREQACDAAAVERTGDPVEVARALTEIARLGMPTTGVSVASCSLSARVAYLLEPPRPERGGWIGSIVVVVTVALAAGGPVHSGIEHLITFMLH